MSATIREQIIERIAGGPSASGGLQLVGGTLAGLVANNLKVPVYRTRLDSIPEAELPAFVVVAEKEERGQYDAEDQELKLQIAVFCVTAKGSNYPSAMAVDQIADPLTAWVQQKVMADKLQGGLSTNTEYDSAVWANAPEDLDLTGVKMMFTITYWTKRNDPTVQALVGYGGDPWAMA